MPRASEYVQALPAGLESFARCEARSSVFEPYARDFRALSGEPGLPAPIAALLSGRLSARPWAPEVVFQAAYLVVRDLAFEDDAAFHRWIFSSNQEMFDKPLLRNLVRLVSPGLMVIGAAKRWSAFHVGSDLVSAGLSTTDGRTSSVTHLTYPEGLFPRTFLLGLEHAFMAAVLASRAKDPEVELGAVAPGRATFTASWRA